MSGILEWLTGLPEPLLYGALLLAAFAENLFPPLPADTVVALGAFVAARGNGNPIGAWLATMIGNIGGAMTMYYVGHRFGLPWLQRRFPGTFGADKTERITQRFEKGGVLAVAVSRFLPAVRALVPPVAGAISFGAWRALIAMTIASGAWYALVCFLAYRAGANAEALLQKISSQQRAIGIAAAALVIVIGGVLWWRHRRASAR